ncbi:hypothetical protein [Haloarcula onubensis]|uniref:Uncharacterized protein n=1 Tax=Haloarcula onubensis TaxID=2950539 RepID=A0ABU2FIX9_9EURY|nr:hypothetical protein [Halomicroarcula sp. S3CR25-11]MDS0280698.1 hypothetical protein [Halomicroarcula sp. S3CR25-11]
MEIPLTSPGPDAAHAFRLGLRAGAVVGIAGIMALYYFGVIELLFAGYALLVLFPVYLVFVAVVLSVWLGYDKDATALRPVYRRN